MEISKKQIEFYNNKINKIGKLQKIRNRQAFKIEKGKIPVVISAPHCVEQTRNGKIKRAEGETGAIAQKIAKDLNCYVIYKTYNNQDDANYDIENNSYKKDLKQLIIDKKINLLIDLHGAKMESDFDVEIGTDNGKNISGKSYIIKELKQILKKNGITNITENQKFKASSEHTISKYIHEETKIICIQLEVTGKYRYIKNIEGINKLVNGIEEFIKWYKRNEYNEK